MMQDACIITETQELCEKTESRCMRTDRQRAKDGDGDGSRGVKLILVQ